MAGCLSNFLFFRVYLNIIYLKVARDNSNGGTVRYLIYYLLLIASFTIYYCIIFRLFIAISLVEERESLLLLGLSLLLLLIDRIDMEVALDIDIYR